MKGKRPIVMWRSQAAYSEAGIIVPALPARRASVPDRLLVVRSYGPPVPSDQANAGTGLVKVS